MNIGAMRMFCYCKTGQGLVSNVYDKKELLAIGVWKDYHLEAQCLLPSDKNIVF